MDIIEELVLYDQYLYRRLTDVGFREFVDKQIRREENGNKFKKVILDLLSRSFQEPAEIQRIMDEEGLYLKTVLPTSLRMKEDMEGIFSNSFIPGQEMVANYLSKKRLEFEANSDPYAIKAIDLSLAEMISGSFIAQSMMIDQDSIEGSMYEDYYRYKYQRYIFENLHFYIIYITGHPDLAGIKHLTDIIDTGISDFIVQALQTLFKVKETDLIYYSPFVNNSISICSALWFWNLTKSEKIAVMNKEYSPKLFSVYKLDDWFSVPQKEKLIFLTNEQNKKFIELGYELEGIGLLKSAIKNKIYQDIDHRHFLHLEIATNYRIMGEFRKGGKFLEKYLKKTDSKHSYTIFLSKIRLAELLSLSGKQEDGDKILNSVLKKIKHQSRNEQIKLLGNISHLYRRIFNFGKELEILSDINKFIDLELIPILKERYEVLNSWQDGHMSNDDLMDHEFVNEIEISFKKGGHTFDAFYFERAIYHMSKAISKYNGLKSFSLKQEYQGEYVISLFYRGFAYLYRREYHLSYHDLNEVIKLTPDHHNSMSLVLLLCHKLNISSDNLLISAIKNYTDYELSELTMYFVENHFNLYKFEELGKLLNYLTSIFETANKKQYLKTEYYLDIGNRLAKSGIQDEAIKYYKLGAKQDLKDFLQATYMENIGSVHANMDKHQSALKYYKKALDLKIPELVSNCYGNKAASYGALMEFDKAVENIEKCINSMDLSKTSSEMQLHRTLEMDYYKKMVDQKILINRIPEKYLLIRKFIRTAEITFNQFAKNTVFHGLDAFSPMASYAKAMERMLHLIILKKYLSFIEMKFNFNLPDEILSNSRAFILKGVINKRRSGIEISLSLGQWIGIYEHRKDVLNSHFYNYITSEFGFDIFLEIVKILQTVVSQKENLTIVKIRNNINHISDLQFDELSDLRGKIIVILNKMIELLFPI